MNIRKSYTTSEQATLLKEKGFNEETSSWVQHGNGISGEVEGRIGYYNKKGDVYTSLPEQWQVVEWLRHNYGIWVEVNYMDEVLMYGWKFTELKTNEYFVGGWKYTSPQEAYSAAFDHILMTIF